MTPYQQSFIAYLVKNGYNQNNLKPIDSILSRGLRFKGVAVLEDKEKNPSVIQVFALMSEKERREHNLYPFYRTMKWENNTLTPSGSIATQQQDGSWVIYDAHDSRVIRGKDYLDYNQAVERFNRRGEVAPVRNAGHTLRYTSWGLAALFLLYTVIAITFPCLNLLLDGSIISLFVLVAILVLLPLIIYFVKGISAFGIDVFFKNN